MDPRSRGGPRPIGVELEAGYSGGREIAVVGVTRRGGGCHDETRLDAAGDIPRQKCPASLSAQDGTSRALQFCSVARPRAQSPTAQMDVACIYTQVLCDRTRLVRGLRQRRASPQLRRNICRSSIGRNLADNATEVRDAGGLDRTRRVDLLPKLNDVGAAVEQRIAEPDHCLRRAAGLAIVAERLQRRDGRQHRKGVQADHQTSEGLFPRRGNQCCRMGKIPCLKQMK